MSPSDKHNSESRLVIVSNRLPVVLTQGEDEKWTLEPASGGLVTAMAPVLRNRGGVWLGWPGTRENEEIPNLTALLGQAGQDYGYDLLAVPLSDEEVTNYYYGFANEVIWPMFHDLQTLCNFNPDYWQSYRSVNEKFAGRIADQVQRHDYIWVHDYHLIHVGQELRRIGVESSIGFYLHIPFPPLDLFLKLPWRQQVLRALLHYNLIGFQTVRDRRNFLQCVEKMIPDASIGEDSSPVVTVRVGDLRVDVGAFPISIDFDEFAGNAASPEVKERSRSIRKDFHDRQLILGVDRLDYTKGVPYRLDAFKNALRRYPALRQKVSFIQVLVPSRKEIPKYNDLKAEVEGLVGEINGEFAESGWVPIHYIFRSLDQTELLACYRAADIGLVTPLKDGMNLVAKEYCACKVEEDGVLILSEFAGAAGQLQKGSILVNPYDIEGMADALYQAFKMPADKRKARMRQLRETIREQDIYWWVDAFLTAAFSRELKQFPVVEDYIPQVRI